MGQFRWKKKHMAAALAAAVVVGAGAYLMQAGVGAGGKPELTVLNGSGALEIPLSEVSETARFYPVEVDGVHMEVLAVKDSEGKVRTAYNTCQVCFASGRGYYRQQGEQLVCQNCGNRFSTDEVERMAGGCNPWPIFEEQKTVDQEKITIPYQTLARDKTVFANWQKR